jgi:hypothetical protein
LSYWPFTPENNLLDLLVQRTSLIKSAELLNLHAVRLSSLVLHRRIIPTIALLAGQYNQFSWHRAS